MKNRKGKLILIPVGIIAAGVVLAKLMLNKTRKKYINEYKEDIYMVS